MDTDADGRLRKWFPQLCSTDYVLTSPADRAYNCVSWAILDTSRWWWPVPMGTYYWPSVAPMEETLRSFVVAFEANGFAICKSDEFELGVLKIAVYVKDGVPTHVARQLDGRMWSSKLGQVEDLSHTLDGLKGEEYGDVALIMARPQVTA